MSTSSKRSIAVVLTKGRIFKTLILKLLDLNFLRRQPTTPGDGTTSGLLQFTEDDDLDLALYYLGTLSNIFRWAPDAVWAVLARKTVSSEAYFPSLSQISRLSVFLQRGGLQLTQTKQLASKATSLCRSFSFMHA